MRENYEYRRDDTIWSYIYLYGVFVLVIYYYLDSIHWGWYGPLHFIFVNFNFWCVYLVYCMINHIFIQRVIGLKVISIFERLLLIVYLLIVVHTGG